MKKINIKLFSFFVVVIFLASCSKNAVNEASTAPTNDAGSTIKKITETTNYGSGNSTSSANFEYEGDKLKRFISANYRTEFEYLDNKIVTTKFYNNNILKRTNVSFVKPESVKAFELGYRGQLKGFSYDINGYYNIYNNFIGNLTVVAPKYGVAQDARRAAREL